MMLRSKSKNATGPIEQGHKKRQIGQFEPVKNVMEPLAKKAPLKKVQEISEKISDFTIDSVKRGTKTSGKENNANHQEVTQAAEIDPCPNYDYDKEEAGNPDSVSTYANEIFKYYKAREVEFRVRNYMKQNPELDVKSRAILVDWLVELQETFELNHETLYNAVKLLDTYLSRSKNVTKDDLQLIACGAIFLASKFDERSPPLVDDLIYMGGDRFDRNALINMELKLFSTVGYDLGAPLSYRYLRRLGRVCRVDMATLTLARYILESSLLVFDYSLISGCRVAAAAFLLAMKMKDRTYDWNPVLEKYSGFTGNEIYPLMNHLNHTMYYLNSKWKQLKNVREKYSHEAFFEAAKVPLLPDILGDKSTLLPLEPTAFP